MFLRRPTHQISNSNLIRILLNEEGANKKKCLNIFNKVYFNSSRLNRAHPQITRNKHYNNQSYLQATSEFRMRMPKRVSRVDMSTCVCALFDGRSFMLCSFMFHIIFFYRTQPHTQTFWAPIGTIKNIVFIHNTTFRTNVSPTKLYH